MEGVRTHIHPARAAVAAPGADGRADRVGARLGDRVLRLGGPVAGGRGGAQALADAGRRGAVSASRPGAAQGTGHRRGRRPPAGRGAGGGPHHGCAPAQARHLQGERLRGDLGVGAVGFVAARAGARHSLAPGRRVSRGAVEPGVSGMAGGGDPPGADRGADVGVGVASAGAHGARGCRRPGTRPRAPAAVTSPTP